MICLCVAALPHHQVMSSLSTLGRPVQIVKEWKLPSLHQDGLNGSGVNIFILDTNVAGRYAPLPPKFIGVKDCIGSEYEDINWNHGTGVATIAAGAKCKDFEGGVAPAATVGVCRVSLDGIKYPSQCVCSALQYLLKETSRVDIISMSFGYEKIDTEIEKCINELTNQGVVCVAAARNDGCYQTSVLFPASDKNVISDGSYQPTGHPSLFNTDANIDVYAPGENLYLPGFLPMKGTSYAAPAIAGLIALLIQQVRKLNNPELEKHLRNVNVLRKIFENDLKARGKNLLAPHELLEDNPHKLGAVITKYIML